jgi:bifunctional DNA-binding transcriptional regulator/antitoxin component of YhaV-PrlF toxin-antitoxin module
MKTSAISRGGQISIPASIRRRWGTSAILVEDRGDSVVIRPLPEDPIGAAKASLAARVSTDQARGVLRREEAASEARRTRR